MEPFPYKGIGPLKAPLIAKVGVTLRLSGRHPLYIYEISRMKIQCVLGPTVTYGARLIDK